MPKKSAGVLVYKRVGGRLMVFLVHPGGPFWAKKDQGAWSIPKGEFSEDEEGFAAARREFYEEVGQAIDGDFLELTPRRQPSGKIVCAWAVEGDVDAERIRSNEFEIEWPPKSGRMQRFPEVDAGAWFDLDEAKPRIQPGQIPILEELCRLLGATDECAPANPSGKKGRRP
jgi:predicted NUDIX family NTP pyrophosphohydrolase